MRYSIAVKGEGINKKKDVCVCIQDSVSNMRKWIKYVITLISLENIIKCI